MHQTESEMRPRMFFMERPRWRALSDEQISLIHESRIKDLENIRLVSLYSILPLILLSFGGGYFLATFMLRPLEKLNNEIKIKEMENLGERILFDDNGDEISELIKSFNLMSAKLSIAFESQKQFVENASHEIKTPLSIIQANLDTVLQNRKVPKEELKKLLENSKKQISLMDNLTENLLLLSHMSSKARVQMEDLDVPSLINNTVNVFEEKAKEKNIKIVFKSTGSEFKMRGNALLLERAFGNIVENSIKYSGGSRISVLLEKEKDIVSIQISDNGKGISKKHREKVFERFYRVDRGRSRKEGGSGLGLAISKEIIERHGGEIFLDEECIKGIKFKIIFKES